MKSRKVFAMAICLMVGIVFIGTGAFAGRGSTPGNGFPSGPHYNLNMIGKKAGFDGCTIQLDEYGNPIYGNVVFVPENGDSQIFMTSGSGKKTTFATTLQVTDQCAGFDGTGAVVEIPVNTAGYRVFARALAKPTDNPTMKVIPSLYEAVDEYGTPLLYLGTVTSNGFVKADGETFTRTKGKATTVPISDLFNWQGYVCYETLPVDPAFDPTLYPPTPLCLADTNGDGKLEFVSVPADGVCPDGSTLYPLYCQAYTTPTWVFNIADLVTYLWDVSNTGVKLVQIRFYPN